MNYKMIVLILTFVLLVNMISRFDSQPVFCETHQFDGAYNFGPFVVIRKHNWIWLYDYHKQVMREPALRHSHVSTLESNLLLTSFYINKVPKCESSSDYANSICDDYKKALYLVPILLHDYTTKQSFANVYRIAPNGTVLDSQKPGFPWFMDVLNYDIWPQQWQFSESTFGVFSRASVYWSDRYELLFIVDNGNLNSSTILYNKITANNWWLNLREQKLFTKIHFTGLFHFNDKTYALADNRHDSDNQTKLYNVLVSKNNRFSIEQNAIGLKEFFGCEPKMKLRTTLSDHQLSGEEVEEVVAERINKQHSSDSLLDIPVIMIIVLVIIIATIIVIVVIVMRKIKKSRYTFTLTLRQSEYNFS